MAGIRLLDVTLRDCATVNEWRFTDEQVAAVAGVIDDSHYDFVELGYFLPARRIAGEPRSGPGVCDPEYLGRTCPGLRHARPVVMVRMSEVPTAELGRLAAAGVAMVRLPIHSHEVLQTREYVAACHALGIQVSVNLIFLSQRTVADVVSTAAVAQRLGADVFCVADTLSGLLPGQTTEIVTAVVKELSIPLGFHAHDGLRCTSPMPWRRCERGRASSTAHWEGWGAAGPT